MLTEADYIQWKPLRLDYLIEEDLPNDLTDTQLFNQFLEKAERKIIWGLFLKNVLVSIADLNAKALDLGQVGGVYTIDNFTLRLNGIGAVADGGTIVSSTQEVGKILILSIDTSEAETTIRYQLEG